MTSAPSSWRCQCGAVVPMGCSHTCGHVGPPPSPHPWGPSGIANPLQAVVDALSQSNALLTAQNKSLAADAESHDEWLNNLMDYADESFDGDEAMEAIATRYVRALELVADEALRVVLRMGHGDKALWDALHDVFPEKVPADA